MTTTRAKLASAKIRTERSRFGIIQFHLGEVSMNSFKTLTSCQREERRRMAISIVATLLLVSFSVAGAACKGKAETPAVTYSRVPDGAPQNSYADVVSRVAPAVVTIHANK